MYKIKKEELSLIFIGLILFLVISPYSLLNGWRKTFDNLDGFTYDDLNPL